jgi:hypothetical protein
MVDLLGYAREHLATARIVYDVGAHPDVAALAGRAGL